MSTELHDVPPPSLIGTHRLHPLALLCERRSAALAQPL